MELLDSGTERKRVREIILKLSLSSLFSLPIQPSLNLPYQTKCYAKHWVLLQKDLWSKTTIPNKIFGKKCPGFRANGFILPISIKWVPWDPGDIEVMSKLPPHSGSAALRQLNSTYKKYSWSLIFLKKYLLFPVFEH